MAINKKLIHFKTKQKFDEELAKGNILSTSIVFIQDTTEIYTHGQLYDGSKVDLSKLEEAISKIKTDGDGTQYLTNDGTYKVPQIIVNSEEELNALNVPEGTEAIVFYPEATYTEEEFNNSEQIQSMVSYITIDGFDTSKVLTNTYTSSGSFSIPCKSSKGDNYNKIVISYNEQGITTIFLNEIFSADLIIYSSGTWSETASNVYDFEMDYLTTLSEEQYVIFQDIIGSEYKYKSFSHAIKYVYCNLGWTYSKSVFNNNSMCNISEFIPYYASIFGKPNAGEVIHIGSGILLGISLIDGLLTSFNGETIEKYEAYNTGYWLNFNPIESYRILTEKDVSVSIPTLTDSKVPIEQLPLTTTGDGTKFLSDNGNYKELNIPTKVSQLENDANYTSSDNFKTINGESILGEGNIVVEVNASDLSDYVTKDELSNVAVSGSYNDLTNKPTIPTAVTESTISGWGFTKNTGTVTGVKMNGSTKNPSSGIVDLGTVITTIDSSMSSTSTNSVQNKVIKSYIDSNCNIPTETTTASSKQLTANKYYRWTNTPTSITITLATPSNTGIVNNYMFEFTASSSGCTLSVPSTIKWINGTVPSIEAGKTYQISIINNLATIAKFS